MITTMIDSMQNALRMDPVSARFLVLVWGTLILGSLVRWVATMRSKPGTRAARFSSLRTWWMLLSLVTGAVLCGEVGVAVLLWGFGMLGLREFHRLVLPAQTSAGRSLLYVLATGYYLAAITVPGWETWWGIWPVAVTLVVSGGHAALGQTTGYVRTVASSTWAFLVLICFPSHALMVESVAGLGHGVLGFLILLVLTESNDIAQALWGRRFGKHRVTPVVSPHKTWEGLVLGILTTVGLSIFFDSLLGGLGWWRAAALGGAIGIAGFFGDITMSAVKRDCGVKDSGDLLPGQGGVLDRIDSLTATAPVYYYLTMILPGVG